MGTRRVRSGRVREHDGDAATAARRDLAALRARPGADARLHRRLPGRQPVGAAPALARSR